MEERWKLLRFDGFPDIWVSDLGRIRRLSGKITEGTTTRKGYKQIALCNGRKQKCLLVNRLVAMAFIENPQNLPQTNHLDGCKTNNALSNLEWCDAKQNASHAHKLGLVGGLGDDHWTRKFPERVKRGTENYLSQNPLKGEQHSQAKLTEADVREIRRLRANGEKLDPLAKRYGVSVKTISLISRGERWSHVGKKVTVGATE